MIGAFCLLPTLGCDSETAIKPDSGSADLSSSRDNQTSDSPITTGDSAAPDTSGSCGRAAPNPDRTRYLVMGKPYDKDSEQAGTYEVLTLSEQGTLSRPGTIFEMRRNFSNRIHFTVDGAVGLSEQEDGTVGVFRIDGDGKVEVIDEAFKPEYVSRLIPSPNPDEIYALNSAWRNHGGGVYRLRIGCDGALADEGMVAPSKAPRGMAFLNPTTALVAAHDLLDSPAGDDLHLLDLTDNTLAAGVDVFAENPGVSDLVISPDGKLALIANAGIGSKPAVAAVRIEANGSLTSKQVLTGIVDDPAAILFSPFGKVAVVLDAMGDGIKVLDYDADSATPLTYRGPATTSSKPLLPGGLVMIGEGTLKGHFFVGENTAIRHLRFTNEGKVEEVEFFDTGSGSENIVGGIGLQP